MCVTRSHDARHTAATLLLQQGVAARVAMQVLGRSQITLTLGTYSHVVPELRRTRPKAWAELSGRIRHNGRTRGSGSTRSRRSEVLPRLDLNQEPCD